MPYTLPSLPYNYTDLEPYIDTKTMGVHHSKHHAGYVAKLNKSLEGRHELKEKSVDYLLKNLDAIPENIRTAIRNAGGGHANHSLFWKVMKKNGGGKPCGELAEALNSAFGDFECFKKKFNTVASDLFGSGWAWLVVNELGVLEVMSTLNQDSPISDGKRPLLCLDVWEHAYYLNYQNRRQDFIEAWWNVVNWEQVAENFQNEH